MDEVNFSSIELEILKWVQEGKSNADIGTIIGKTQWAVKYHLANIMKKLDVSSRTQAVSQAIGLGVLELLNDGEPEIKRPVVHMGIVGCGSGGEAVLDVLKDNPSIKIVGIAERDSSAPGLSIARALNIPIVSDFRKLVTKKLDVIMNLTGSKEVAREIDELKKDGTEVMGGISSMLMWQLSDERRKRKQEKEKVLREHEALYHLGLIIESIDSMKDAASAVVDYATKILNMPAGSLAIFDEKKEVMRLAAIKGFSSRFRKQDEWTIRKGGLTSKVFNSTGPMFIPDLKTMPNMGPLLLKEGVRSVLAAPLVVEGRIIGILYVNDFKKRLIRAEDISIFSIITVYAAMTIERVKSIEEMRMMSIVDGLTGLYNHRYIMEQLQKEHERAKRHMIPFSVIMLDIDHFKPYNDQFGHLEGNKVLKEVAAIFRRTSRTTDTLGRFGGEEFCIVVPELSKKEAVHFAERLLKEVADHKFPNREITLSGGVATYPQDAESTIELLEKADLYLYEAKKAGRNRICCSEKK